MSEAGGEKVIEITRSNPTAQVEKLAQFCGGSVRRLIGETSGVGIIANHNGVSKKTPTLAG
ncbi:MAG: hypothetical protein BA865_02340 [Desulfobacterales bacterium S5133MH4]|nr:MAG: hypothetical protein BA865_02340 [Desulfobacterales bacterium S5133MH4]